MEELSYPEQRYQRYLKAVSKVQELVESLDDSTSLIKRELLLNCIIDRMKLQELKATESVDQLLDLARIKYSKDSPKNDYQYADYISKLLLSETLDSRAIILLTNLGFLGAKYSD